MSVALALPVAAGSVDLSHSTVAGGGQTMAGGVVSTTVMIWLQVAALPHASTAVQVRVMIRSCGHLPGATLSL